MLKVCFYDGFTNELVSFEALFTEGLCEVSRYKVHGETSDQLYSIILKEQDFDLLCVLEALYRLNERYESSVDGLGSIACTFEWSHERCCRYFSGRSLSSCADIEADKQILNEFEQIILNIREILNEGGIN